METRFRGRAALHGETLVVAGLHLGRGAASAVEAPVGDGADVCERLESHVESLDPDVVVIAGDVLHAFERVPRGVESRLDTLSMCVRRADARLVVVPGNHDTMLDTVWDGPTTDAHWLDDRTAVVHGHVDPDVAADRYVLGHDHPSIELAGKRRPCFLDGPGGPAGTEVLVLPAFNRFTAGVPVNEMDAGSFQSPLVTDADALAPVVRDEAAGETLRFPPLGTFRDRIS